MSNKKHPLRRKGCFLYAKKATQVLSQRKTEDDEDDPYEEDDPFRGSIGKPDAFLGQKEEHDAQDGSRAKSREKYGGTGKGEGGKETGKKEIQPQERIGKAVEPKALCGELTKSKFALVEKEVDKEMRMSAENSQTKAKE